MSEARAFRLRRGTSIRGLWALIAGAAWASGTIAAMGANMQRSDEATLCLNNTKPVAADDLIAACAGVIQSGRLRGVALSYAFNNRGNGWNDKGESDRAIADFDEAIKLNPRYAVAFYNRGRAWRAKGDNDRAIADFDEAIKLNPKTAAFFIIRGNARRDKGDNDRAIGDYDEAIKLDPKDALAFINRGNAWQGKGDDDRAIADYDEAIKLDPKDA